MESRLQPAVDCFMHGARDQDPARWRFGFQPRGDVHAIAIKIVAVDDQVAEVQADAEDDGGVRRLIPIGFGHCLLELDCGTECIHGAGELGQRAIARQLDQPPAMTRQHRLQPLRPMGLQPRQRAVLIPAHQPRVAHDICRKDGRQSPYNPLAGQRPPPWH